MKVESYISIATFQQETVTCQLDNQANDRQSLKNGQGWIDVEKGEGKPLREIERIVKYIRLSMTVFGIYYPFKRNSVALGGRNTKRNRCRPTKFLIYNIIILLCLWSGVVKTVVAIFYTEELSIREVTIKLIGVCWQLQVTLNATIMTKVSRPCRANQDKAIIEHLDTVLIKLKSFDIETDSTCMRRKILIVFFLGWCFVVVNVASLVVILFLPNGLINDSGSAMVLAPLPTTLATKIVLAILLVFSNVAWIHPVVYFVTMTTVLKYAFQLCNRALQKELEKSTDDKNNVVFPERLPELRTLHLEICKTVEILDRDFSYLLANLYATSIPLACCIVYSLIKTELDLFYILLHVFWAMVGEFCVIISSLFAASLQESAHAPLNRLYKTSFSGITLEKFGEVHMFLSKLTGSTIGFSVLGFFVVTKEVLLTIGGLFLTYVILLIQF